MARTMSQQMMEKVRAVANASHALQVLTEIDPRATVMSIDGISAFDLFSRQAMLQGLMDLDGGSSALSFVALFCGTPSSYLWEDYCGRTHTILQGEGGEQGDAVMPLLFSLSQHSTLAAMQAQMRDGEVLLIFHDGIHTVTMPERVGEVYALLAGPLWTCLQVLSGPTLGYGCIRGKHNCGTESVRTLADGSRWSEQLWQKTRQPSCGGVQRNCPHIKVHGTPLGHPDFVQAHSDKSTAQH